VLQDLQEAAAAVEREHLQLENQFRQELEVQESELNALYCALARLRKQLEDSDSQNALYEEALLNWQNEVKVGLLVEKCSDLSFLPQALQAKKSVISKSSYSSVPAGPAPFLELERRESQLRLHLSKSETVLAQLEVQFFKVRRSSSALSEAQNQLSALRSTD
jgi:hypothetical protein